MNYKEYAKAIVGAVLAGLGVLATSLTDNVVTPVEWIGVASAFLATGAVVFGVPNAEPATVDDGPDHRAD